MMSHEEMAIVPVTGGDRFLRGLGRSASKRFKRRLRNMSLTVCEKPSALSRCGVNVAWARDDHHPAWFSSSGKSALAA
ncbi:MAG: hypothetical protein MUF49_11365 [Oculatellaceae cyanobacterium Prado106]|nr:hypothetical protein [Oculatellaceae cyanobacterium Prado106]